MRYSSEILFTASACLSVANAVLDTRTLKYGSGNPSDFFNKRQLPAAPSGVQSILSPSGVNITYKDTSGELCETTPGVKSYAGFVNLSPDAHSFFWFFESRNDPSTDPVTLWLNGGPGSDSLIGLFEELGPCHIAENLTSYLNPYSWNNVTNLLILSQPLGTGFSYGGQAPGYYNEALEIVENATQATPDGRYPTINATEIDTTELAAMAGWEVIQGFYSALPQLDSNITSKEFNLATESYGGHYGPAFFHYFQDQSALVDNGTINGTKFTMHSLLIINGIIDEYIQAPYYPEFAVNNTYGIKAYNDTVYNYAQFALNMPNGCLQQIEFCYQYNETEFGIESQGVCTEAENMCRDNVEGLYYSFSGRNAYDIRAPSVDPTPPGYFLDYLNQASVQAALGVDTNYSAFSNLEVYYAFQQTGDFVFNNFLEDLEDILDSGVRVSLVYGDADYICNWFGGQAISLALNYTNSAEFAKTGYVGMMVDGVQYGETREYGNFSFTRVYESGHEVPYYQPVAALAIFNRTINGYDTATGTEKVTADLATNGTAETTHTESYVALPSSTSAAASSATMIETQVTSSASTTSTASALPIPRNVQGQKWARYFQ